MLFAYVLVSVYNVITVTMNLHKRYMNVLRLPSLKYSWTSRGNV